MFPYIPFNLSAYRFRDYVFIFFAPLPAQKRQREHSPRKQTCEKCMHAKLAGRPRLHFPQSI